MIKIKLKKTLTACIVMALIFSLAACGEDSKEKESSKAISNTAKATADSTPKAEKETETPDNTEMPTSTENPTATPGQEDTDVDSTTEPTDASTLEPTTAPTKVPTTVTTKTPANIETKAPTAKPTVAPTKTPTAEPVSTVKPTEAPVATKTPIIALPTEDPSVDYSQWGYYGFEKLLPAPLPFSDETDWLSQKVNSRTYKLKNSDSVLSVSKEEFIQSIKEYVQSLEKYEYIVVLEQHYYYAGNEAGNLFEFACGDRNLSVTIYLNR